MFFIYVHLRVHIYVCIYICVDRNNCTHTYICIYVYMYICAYICTCIYIHREHIEDIHNSTGHPLRLY